MCVNKTESLQKTSKPDTCCPFSHTNRDTTLQYCFVGGRGGGIQRYGTRILSYGVFPNAMQCTLNTVMGAGIAQ